MIKSASIIQHCLLNNQRSTYVLGTLTSVVAVLIFIYCYYQSFNRLVALMILASLLLILSVYLLYSAWKDLNPDKNSFLQQLKNQPKHVVWVHSYRIVSMPFGVHLFKSAGIYIHTKHKQQYLVRVPDSKLEEIMDHLNEDLPHATFGYSVKKEQLYKANPNLLYVDED